MSIQYRDGSFSETMKAEQIMERLQQEMEDNFPIKAVHFGTPSEIEEAKEKADIIKRMDGLEEKIKDMSPVKTILEIPTNEEIKKFMVKKKKVRRNGKK